MAETDAAFLQRAKEDGLRDGTTAVFALLCGRRFLIGSIGDSFAILCSSGEGGGNTTAGHSATASRRTRARSRAAAAERGSGANRHEVQAEVLSAAHSPAREDELQRIENAGGFVRSTAGPAGQANN